jgi:hypothetical protein
MRALCGAIITAGALIGLGLTALGIGTRYSFEQIPRTDGNTEITPILVHISQMDRPLVFILVFLTCVAMVGLGIAFVGLAYHHHRRHHELLLAQGNHTQHHHSPGLITHPDTGVTTR